MHLPGQILLCQQTVPTRMHWILPLKMISHKATHKSSILDLLLTRELNIVFDITVGRSPSGNSDYHCLNAINELPVKFITLPFFSTTPIRWFDGRVRNFGDLGTFSINFCFQMLNVRHISISGLFDLLTWKVYHTRRPRR